LPVLKFDTTAAAERFIRGVHLPSKALISLSVEVYGSLVASVTTLTGVAVCTLLYLTRI
jgi:hypothetical protein